MDHVAIGRAPRGKGPRTKRQRKLREAEHYEKRPRPPKSPIGTAATGA